MFSFYICKTFNGNAKKMSGFGIKDCLTETSLCWKRFGTYNEDQKIYTFNDKFVRELIRRSIRV